MFTSPFRALTFGEILDGAFTLYRRHFLTLFITALLPYVPVGIVGGWFATRATSMAATDPAAYMGVALVTGILASCGMVVIWGALTRQLSQAYTGGPVALGDGLRQGGRSFFYIAVAGFFAYVIGFVVMFVLMMVFGVFAALAIPAGGDTPFAIVMMVIAFVAALVVVLAVFSLFFAVVPAVVVERRNPFDALWRSITLASGALPRVMGVVVVSTFIVLLPILGGVVALGMTQGFQAVASGTLTPVAMALQQLISTLSYALTFPFFCAAFLLLYYDRRARTEAHDLEGMVRGMGVAEGPAAPQGWSPAPYGAGAPQEQPRPYGAGAPQERPRPY